MALEHDELGRIKAYEPTDITRAEVAALKSFGNTHIEIANYLDIHEDTLVKYYSRELETAVIKANAQVARGLFNKATKQDDLQAQIFWLKTRARWRTVDKDNDDNQQNSVLEKILNGEIEVKKK